MNATLEKSQSVKKLTQEERIQLAMRHEVLKKVLQDEENFQHVVVEMFRSIDNDEGGSLSTIEIRKFINNICKAIGLEKMPTVLTHDEIFAELDEDGSGEVSLSELREFMKMIFRKQLEALEKKLQA